MLLYMNYPKWITPEVFGFIQNKDLLEIILLILGIVLLIAAAIPGIKPLFAALKLKEKSKREEAINQIPRWVKSLFYVGVLSIVLIFIHQIVRWYGLMYLFAFITSFIFFKKQIEEQGIKATEDDMYNFFGAIILGLLLGARLFSVFIYSEDPGYYLANPWKIFWFFENGQFTGLPGMSYHGGLVGGVIGGVIYCYKHKRDVWQWADLVCTAAPLGYTWGRIGNFINEELYGRVALSKIGMLFSVPREGMFDTHLIWVKEAAEKVGIDITGLSKVNLPRHPSQLYEAFFEGILLFAILWLIRKKKPFNGFMVAAYVFGYGLFRFIVEYFRAPDANLGYVIEWGPVSDNYQIFQSLFNFSTGQVLCFIMMVAAIIVGFWAKASSKKRKKLS